MSAGVKSVPPWKLALIEKRRKQEEEDRVRRREEEERLTKMPTWKRDILLKKQQQKNSHVFFAKPGSNSPSDLDLSPRGNSEVTAHELLALDESVNIDNHVPEQVAVSNHDPLTDCVGDSPGQGTRVVGGPSEEHIIPIQQNPWLRTDIKQRKYPRHSRPNSGSDQYDNATSTTNSYNSLPRNHGSSSWREPGDVNDSTNEAEQGEDEIFNDNQEVAYGRGFVHKLLKKFKHLSTRDDKGAVVTVTAVGPKRAHSTENILEDSYGSEKSSPRHYCAANDASDGGRPTTGIYASPVKARSMENLAGSNKHSHTNLDVKIVTERRDSSQGSLDGSFSSGSMQSPRSTTGNDAPIHYNVCDDEPSNTHDTQVVPPEEPVPSLKRYGSSENLIEDELPRANIVSSTRCLFENVTGTLTISKTMRKAPSPKVETVEFKPLPNGSATEDEHLECAPAASRLEGESRDGVSPRADSVPQLNGEASNDRNANYKSEDRGVFSESRTGIGSAVGVRSDQASSFNGSWLGSAVVQESNIKTTSSHSIMQKNNQNNNRLSAAISPTANNTPSEIISPDKGSSIKAEYNLANSSKKRHAPLPPSSTTGDSKPHVSVVQVNDKDDDVHTSVAHPKKPNLYLDLGSSDSRTVPAKQPAEESLSYRDLYFSRSTPSPSSSSSYKNAPSLEDQKDLMNTDISEVQQNGVLDTTMSMSALSSPKSPSSRIKPQPSPSPTSSSSSVIINTVDESSKAKPVTPTTTSSTSFPSPKHSAAPNSSSHSITSPGRPAAPPSSKPANGHAASLTLPIPKAGEVTLNNKKSISKKGKRPASSSSSGPGSLLIRPASNLVPTSSNPNAQLPSIKKYKDVTKGVFQPPTANPTYLKGLEDEFDIPVTNIDDVMDDVPVTNIDDLGDSMTSLPRLEQDADKERQVLSSRYEFVGAGVSTSKNLLIKTRRQKLRITFNDSMTSTYEYPSEQSLLEELPPEPGDFDYIHQLHGRPGHPALPHELSNESDDSEEQLNLKAGGALQSTPGLGSTVPRAEPTEGDKTGGLMSYRSRYMGDYQLGVETKQSSNQQMQPEEKEPVIEESVQITPAEDDDTYNWSNAATSDLLF